MDISNELRVKIFAAYWGCDVLTPDCEGHPDKIEGIYIDRIFTENEGNKNEGLNNLSECQLLLTPLSEITDEHALEVARLNRTPQFDNQLRIGQAIVHWRHTNGYSRDFNAEMVDYLRSLGYDCGYGEIPSLIEAGIAIKKIEDAKAA